MSSRDYRLFLQDIQTSCQKIINYTLNISRKDFVTNDLVYDGTLRNIEIIGEATKHVPDSIRDQFSNVEWRKISGMRDAVSYCS
ncbi:MAG: DUF86 domain-containing protein [Chloroflexi bacterium]|nr:DUF86 domain-containing protein [Chloroflexota bacterium]